jgi:hypothetical protein
MSTENKILDLSFPAAESLASDQYKFVVLNSSGAVRRPDSADEVPIGILQNAPAINEAASVRVIGCSKLEVNAAAAIGAHVGPEYVSATDAGKGALVDPAGASAVVIEAASAEDDLASVLLLSPKRTGVNSKMATVTTDATAGNLTYTAAMLLGGLLLRDPAGGARSDVTPTAAEIVAAIPGCAVGSSFEFTIRNTADASETITVTLGTNVTLSGTMTIAQNNSKRFLAVVTAVGTPAVTIYSLGTIVH